jgi:hypothetical protein
VTGAACRLALTILLAATPAAATPVAIARCVNVHREEARRLVDLEFGTFADPEALRVTVECDQRGVTLAVEDRRTRRRRTRSLDLEHTPPAARARLLALAAAEVATTLLADGLTPGPSPVPVATAAPSAAPSPPPGAAAAPTAASSPAPRSATGLSDGAAPPASAAVPATDARPAPGFAAALATDAPPPPATGPPSAARTPRSAAAPPAALASPPPSPASRAAPARDPLPRLRLLAEVGGAHFFSRLAMTPEVGLTLRHEGWRLLEAAVALSGSLGRVASKGREASAASLCITPLVGLHRRLGPATARVATGPRLALGRLQASAALPGDRAMTFTAPWLGWLAETGLATPLGPRFVVEVVARAGYVLSPIGGRIAGDRAIAVEGPWVGAALSVGALLGAD